MELKEAYEFIESECKDIPTEELVHDEAFSIDFIKHNTDIDYKNVMVIISAYTRYYYNRVYEVVV